MTYYEQIQYLVTIAKKYKWEEVECYMDDIGWQPEWMLDYIDDPDA